MRRLLLEFDTLNYGHFITQLISKYGQDLSTSLVFEQSVLSIRNHSAGLNLQFQYFSEYSYKKLIITCNEVEFDTITWYGYDHFYGVIDKKIPDLIKRKLELIMRDEKIIN